MNLLQQILGEELYNRLLELVGEDGIAKYLAMVTEESTDEEKQVVIDEVTALVDAEPTDPPATDPPATDPPATDPPKGDEVDLSLYVLKTESDRLIEEARQSGGGASILDGWLADGVVDLEKVTDPDLRAYIKKEMEWAEDSKKSSENYIKQYSILNEAIKQGAKEEWDVLQFVALDEHQLKEDGTIDAKPIVEGIKERKPYLFDTELEVIEGVNPATNTSTTVDINKSFAELAEEENQ